MLVITTRLHAATATKKERVTAYCAKPRRLVTVYAFRHLSDPCTYAANVYAANVLLLQLQRAGVIAASWRVEKVDVLIGGWRFWVSEGGE